MSPELLLITNKTRVTQQNDSAEENTAQTMKKITDHKNNNK